MVFLCALIDGTDVVGAGICQCHIDLAAVARGAMALDLFFPVQTAENV